MTSLLQPAPRFPIDINQAVAIPRSMQEPPFRGGGAASQRISPDTSVQLKKIAVVLVICGRWPQHRHGDFAIGP